MNLITEDNAHSDTQVHEGMSENEVWTVPVRSQCCSEAYLKKANKCLGKSRQNDNLVQWELIPDKKKIFLVFDALFHSAFVENKLVCQELIKDIYFFK